jgi:microcompartment protein CcmK/EutM
MTAIDATTKTAATAVCSWAVLVLVAVASTGCMNAARMPQPRVAGGLDITVPVALRDAVVEVTVTGSDMAEPVTSTLGVLDGVARGTVGGISAGQNRLVLITATDRAGRRCAREVNAAVDALAVASIEGVALECQAPERRAIAIASEAGWTYPPVF